MADKGFRSPGRFRDNKPSKPNKDTEAPSSAEKFYRDNQAAIDSEMQEKLATPSPASASTNEQPRADQATNEHNAPAQSNKAGAQAAPKRQISRPVGGNTQKAGAAGAAGAAGTAGAATAATGKTNPPDMKPAEQFGDKFKKAASTMQGIAQRNPKKIMAGGITGLVLALLIFAFSGLIGEFKLSMFMENMYKRGFRHVTHSYVERQKLIMRYYLKESIDPTFNKEAAIVNYERSMMKNLYGRMRGDRKIEKELIKRGYQITFKKNPANPSNHILNIKYKDAVLEANDFDKTYDLMFESNQAGAHINDIASQITLGQSVHKRIAVQRRLAHLTGIKFHWIDKKVNQPLAKMRIQMRNNVVEYILNKSDIAQKAAIKLLSFLTGGSLKASDTEALGSKMATDMVAEAATKELTSDAIGKISTRVLASTLTKTVAEIGVPVVGWALLAIEVTCLITAGITEAYETMEAIAKEKALAEYMTQFVAMESALSQVHNGNTDGVVFGLFLELLNDEKNRDYSQSNNFKRAAGENVPYNHVTDCDNPSELCDAKRPNSVVAGWGGGMFAKMDSLLESNEYKYIPGLPGNVYSVYACKGIMFVLNTAGEFVMGLIVKLIRTIPIAAEGMDWLTAKGGAFINDNILGPLVAHMFAPVVDASTRGPFLTNAVAAGALGSASTVMRSYCGDMSSNEGDAAKQCRLEGADRIAAEEAVNRQLAAEYDRQPLWWKLAGSDNPRSTLSRLALSTPNSFPALANQIASIPQLLFSPRLSTQLAGIGGDILTRPSMAADPGEEPTGVDIYGYTNACLRDTKLNQETEGCKGMAKWDTHIACSMFIGYTKGLEAPPAECDPDADFTPVATAPPDGTPITVGDPKVLAKQILDSKNVTTNGRLVVEDLSAAVAGRPASNEKMLSAKMLAVLVELAKTHKFNISSLEGGGTGHSSGSNHYDGTAVDINSNDYPGLFKQLHNNSAPYELNELIYSNPPSGTTNLLGGTPHSYNGATLSAHNNHIHFSTRN